MTILEYAEITISVSAHDAIFTESSSLDMLGQPIEQTQPIIAEAREIVLDGFRLNSGPELIPHPDRQQEKRNIKIRGGVTPILARTNPISRQNSTDFYFLPVAEAEVCSP